MAFGVDQGRGRAASKTCLAMCNPDQPALGVAVKAIREEKNISQVALSAASGFRQSWVSDLENGRRNPSLSSLVRLATGLGVRTSTLIRRAELLAKQRA
jgi:transcriptional regulator with XRE-family HTH domain